MIVVCPECRTNYTIPDEVLVGDDCNMRCNKCSHTWLEMGKREVSNHSEESFEDALNKIEKTLEEEESLEEPSNDLDKDSSDADVDIDLVSRDIAEEKVVSQNYEDKPKKIKKDKKKANVKQRGGVLAGVFAAFVAFILLFMVSIVLRSSVMTYIPAYKALYAAMGFNIPVDAEGLVFDRIEASWDSSSITVKGNIINLLNTDYTIPKIELIFQSDNNDMLDKVVFSVSNKDIKGEDMVPFEYKVQATKEIEQQTSNIKLSFIHEQD